MKMKQLTPEKLAEVTGGTYNGPRRLRYERFSAVAADSRDVEPGGLFVCFRGQRVDGHRYAAEAVQTRGALCCLTEEPVDVPHVLVPSVKTALRKLAAWDRKLFHIPVVGIVGSLG